MRKRNGVVVLALIAFFSLTGIGISQMTNKPVDSKTQLPREPKKTKDDLYSQVELFSYALTTIQAEYVDEKSPKEIIYGSLKGMLSSLDPHSQFLSPEDFADLKTDTVGKFGGLGVEISIKDGLLTVISPIEDTPAWKVGIKSGDKIVKIGKKLTRDMTLADAVKELRGEPGTVVLITVLRESEAQIKEFSITREIIHAQNIKDVHIIDDHIGYLRLTEFREDSYKDFHDGLLKLKDMGADSLIVDLRNNPGGLLNVSIKICQDFLPAGKVIVSTKGRHSAQDTVSKSGNNHGEFLTWPMVVLINEGSASASEIFAGAMKDNKRAVIVGTTSFGKGSVQSVIPMPDGSGLRLTTAKYFTPSGVSIHGVGIAPDVIVEKPKEDKNADDKKEKKDLDQIFSNVENQKQTPEVSEASKKEAELKKKDEKDVQLQSALTVIKGIKVYRKFQQP